MSDFESGKIIKRLSIWLFIAIVLFSTILMLFADFGKIRKVISEFPRIYVIGIFSSVLVNYFIRFLKWSYFLKRIGIGIPLKDSLWIFFSSFTMILSPGKLGEIIKSLILKSRFSIPISKSAPVVMAERLTDLLGLAVIAAWGSSKFAYGENYLLIIVAVMLLFIALLTQPRFWHYLEKAVFSRFSRLSRFRASIKLLEESSENLLSPSSLLVAIPLSTISWAGEGVALYLIFSAMNVSIPNLLAISLFAHSFSSIAGAFSFLPGGLLVTEGILGVFFVRIAHISKDYAVSATLMIRSATLWFAVILGTIVFLIGRRKDDL
ncbi:MAG: flippase-like domain-containing protein [Candidatus Riflebacteria bacterium]|nr:flippase-like domain-containing protein [Candidatus Riflebacteria bacterium]